MEMSDDRVIEAVLEGLRAGLADGTQRAWDLSPRCVVHALLEASMQSMLDLVRLHPTDRPALLAKLDNMRLLLLSAPGADTREPARDMVN